MPQYQLTRPPPLGFTNLFALKILLIAFPLEMALLQNKHHSLKNIRPSLK